MHALEKDHLEPDSLCTEHQVLRASRTAYSVYAGLMIVGSLLLFFGCFVTLLEAVTLPGLTSTTRAGLLLAVGTVVLHLCFEAARSRAISRWRWIAFLAGVVFLMTELRQFPGVSPTSTLVIWIPVAVGSVYIALARFAVAPHAEVFSRLPLAVRLMAVLLVWGAPVSGVAAVW